MERKTQKKGPSGAPPGERDAESEFDLGRQAHLQGKFEEAIGHYRSAAELDPLRPEYWNNLGGAFISTGRLDEAAEALETAVKLKDDYALAHSNIGNLQRLRGNIPEAERSYRLAIKHQPGNRDVAANLGLVLFTMGAHGEARKWFEFSVEDGPNYTGYDGLGLLCGVLGKHAQAVEWYRKALDLRPDSYSVLNNIAFSYQALGLFPEAITAFNRALDIEPARAEAYQNLANMLFSLDRFDEAVTAFRMAVRVDPDNRASYPPLVVALTYQCSWQNLQGSIENLIANTEKELAENLPISATPFGLLSLPTSHDLRARVTERVARDIVDRMRPARAENQFTYAQRGPKLKIGLVSPNFCRHSAAFLFNGICEHYDRERFEFHGYMLAREHDEMTDFFRQRLDGFHDIAATPPAVAAGGINEAGINVLIDLAGHTRRSRLELFAMRPAPVRASTIGYGSSVGGGLVDYLITDDAMWPEAERKYCSEKLVFMPHASLPGSPREMSETEFTRKTMGLPDEGVVFANFNGHYKIDPETFGLWMRILKRVPGSVLWIMKGSDTSCANLKKEAEIRGVRADRLVFAQQVETSQHIARIRLADIALDGYNLEGGATTLDALWAGVPVVVTSGSPFGNRGRYKMLEVCGMPELITNSLGGYERLAVELATDPGRLAGFRAKLASNIKSTPLFDIALFTRHFERALEMMWDNHEAGNPPSDMHVPAL